MFLLAWRGDPGDLHCRANNDPRRALRGFVSPRQEAKNEIQNENVPLRSSILVRRGPFWLDFVFFGLFLYRFAFLHRFPAFGGMCMGVFCGVR